MGRRKPKTPHLCPVCSYGRPVETLVVVNGHTLFECVGCGVRFFVPFRSPGSSWYESRSHDRILLLEEKKMWNHNQFLRDRPNSNGRLLDLGCGTGWFLSRAVKSGYRVTGIDFDPEAVSLGKKAYGLDSLHVGKPETYAARWAGRFDAVTAFEVIEHTDNPAGFVHLATRFLKRGGVLAVSVPNRERMLLRDAWWDIPPFHLSQWNAPSLRLLLERAGLKVERLVVKSVDLPEIREAISLFLQKRNLRTGIGEAVNQLHTAGPSVPRRTEGAVRAVATLRQSVITAAALPLLPLVALGSGRGSNLYALARRA